MSVQYVARYELYSAVLHRWVEGPNSVMNQQGALLQIGQGWLDGPSRAAAAEAPAPELRVTAVHDPPYFSVYPHANGSYSYDGYIYEVWQLVTRLLGLRYRIATMPSGEFGMLDGNGTWTGMVGELAYGRADIALSWLDFRLDRAAVVDFIDAAPMGQLKPEFFIRRGSREMPSISPAMLTSLLKPLGTGVWWTLLTSVFVLSVVLCLTLRLSLPHGERRQKGEELTWGSCLLSSFRSVVGQGWTQTPSSMAARITTISSWLMGTIIYTSYTANLISSLTVVTVDRPISSLKEFSEQPDWKFAMEPGNVHLNDWKQSEDVYKRELFARTVSGRGFIPLTWTPEVIQSVSQPRVLTYLTSRVYLFHVLGSEACNMVPLNDHQSAKVTSGYIAIAKGLDPLRQRINQLVFQMYQAGELQRFKTKWMASNRVTCEIPSNSKSRSLSFGELLPVLIIIPLAVVVSAAILLLEMAFRYAAKRANRIPYVDAELKKDK